MSEAASLFCKKAAFFCIIVAWACAGSVRAQEDAGGTNFLSLVQGKVEIRRGDGTSWIAGKINDRLFAGNGVRTLERSRAEVVLASGRVLKLGAFSELEIPLRQQVELKRGIFHIFNRDRRSGGEYRLRGEAVAAIRGTDLVVKVSDQEVVLGVLDGAVTLSNAIGTVDLIAGQQGIIQQGQAPRAARLDLSDASLIQWSFYYPAVLNPAELGLDGFQEGAGGSLAAYAQGDLPAALTLYPQDRVPATDAERSYLAGLLLSVGDVTEALALLQAVTDEYPPKNALLTLVAAVRGTEKPRAQTPRSASEWLAESYYLQSRSQLKEARSAARRAAAEAPEFSYAWARVAELEFSFAERKSARNAVERSLMMAPRNAHAVALSGFLRLAEGDISIALLEFTRAIELDSSYPNAWLGRGLGLIRKGQSELGQRDLFIAATLQPQRSIYRSYLGKAFHEVGDLVHARRELDLAKTLDPNDPTAWLYSALLNQQQSRVNTAVEELEESLSKAGNRGLFRSDLLLDEDRAVRGANLAAIYRDAGMEQVSVREASEAVRQDYANFSAHLFLANSFNALRDARFSNLRYETATFSEYLIANLLSPVGGTPLSQQVSQQEYSRLFDRNRFGLTSESTYLSSGQWQQSAAQYGHWGNFAYALEGVYRSIPGEAPNTDLEQRALSLQLKQQVTPEDSVYLQAVYNKLKFGDVSQRYDPFAASPTAENRELQDPNIFAGWHHQWSPGVHTLLLVSSLRDNFQALEPRGEVDGLITDDSGNVVDTMERNFGKAGEAFAVDYESQFKAAGAELQQIWKSARHTFILGGRAQHGEVDTTSFLSFRGDPTAALFYATTSEQGEFTPGEMSQRAETDLTRLNAYGYWQWEILDQLTLMSGVGIDQVTFPINSVWPVISAEDAEVSKVSPKAALTWTPHASSRFRAAYSQSLGGLFYDSSVRLEPVQLAGFSQVFRSLASESLVGVVPGTEFEAASIGAEHRFPSRTYLGWQAELLQSEGERAMGVFAGNPTDFFTLAPAQVHQDISYREESFLFYADQLLGEEWSAGVRYRVSDSDLEIQTPSISNDIWPGADTANRAILQQVNAHIIFNHASGWFGSVEGLWTKQNNIDSEPDLADEDFWQFNTFLGYRWAQRRAELRTGLLNIFDEDYRLNPVSLYAELPRERTWFTSLRLNF